MKKNLILFALSMLVLVGLISCTDGVKKMFQYENPVRIEYSDCNGCNKCIEEFHCPNDAIKKDPKTGYLTNYIDMEKCTQCMKCINTFQCPESAITIVVDQYAPAEINDFAVVSDTIGTIIITFTAPGDDGYDGLVYNYKLNLSDIEGNLLEYDFEMPLLQQGGETEEWTITGLEPDQTITVSLQAFDEMELSSAIVMTDVIVMGLDIDDVSPAQITDLTAESGEMSVILNWTAPGDDNDEGTAQGYAIKYWHEAINNTNWQTANIFETSLNPQSAGMLEELSITGIDIGQNQYFAIRAFDEENNLGDTSNNAQAVITGDITAPADISDLIVSNTSINSMQLNWTAVGDNGLEGTATSYQIKVFESEITSDNWDDIDDYDQNMTPQIVGSIESIMISGLQFSTHYFAAVKAIDEANNFSNLSNVVDTVTAAIPDNIPPSPIEDLAADASETAITLMWTASGDDANEGIAYRYVIKQFTEEINEDNWDDAVAIADPPIPQIAGSEESMILNELEPGLSYFFAIKVEDDEENISNLSNVVESALLLDETAPQSINDLVAEASNTEITLTWTATGDDGNEGVAQEYFVRWNLDPINASNWDESYVLADPPTPSVAGSIEHMILTNLDAGVQYYFAIEVIDDSDNHSDLSNVAVAEILLDEIAPDPVSDLAVQTGSAPGNYSIRITWTATGDDGDIGTVDHYEIKYSQSPITDDNWNSASLAGILADPAPAGSNELYTISGLERGEIYYFAVKPFDDLDNSSSVSNSPKGKLVFSINTGPCNGCGRCVSHCDQDAITDHGSYAIIDPALCIGCGDCVSWCPRNAIQLVVIIP